MSIPLTMLKRKNIVNVKAKIFGADGPKQPGPQKDRRLLLNAVLATCRDECVDLINVPARHAGAQFKGLGKLTITYPAPDGGRADRQQAGFLGGGREFSDADDTRGHLILRYNVT